MDIALREVGVKRPFNKVKNDKNPKKKHFFCRGNFTSFLRKNCSNLRPFLSITFPQGFWIFKNFEHWTSISGVKKTTKWSKLMKKKKSIKKTFFLRRSHFTPFLSKKVHTWDHFFPLLFPKDSKYLKVWTLDLGKMGEERPFTGVNKVWRTDKRTKQNKIRNCTIPCKKSDILENSKAQKIIRADKSCVTTISF